MGQGMRRKVYYNPDPTFDSVLSKFKKEQKRAREQKRAMAAFRVIATVKKIIKIAGYELIGTLVIRDKQSGNTYGRL
jgi:hypothetical protein